MSKKNSRKSVNWLRLIHLKPFVASDPKFGLQTWQIFGILSGLALQVEIADLWLVGLDLRLDQAVADSVFDQFGPVVGAQFLIDIGPMAHHRLGAETKQSGNLSTGLPFSDQFQKGV